MSEPDKYRAPVNLSRTDSAHAAWRDEPSPASEAELVASLRAYIRAIVYAKLFHPEPALEADILGEVWLDLGGFEGRNGAKFSTWVYTVVWNTCRRHIWQRLRRGDVSLDALTEAGVEFATRQEQKSRLEYVSLLENSGLLTKQIDHDIVECKYRGESETEACRRLGITLSCYRQRWHRLGLKLKSFTETEAAEAA